MGAKTILWQMKPNRASHGKVLLAAAFWSGKFESSYLIGQQASNVDKNKLLHLTYCVSNFTYIFVFKDFYEK